MNYSKLLKLIPKLLLSSLLFYFAGCGNNDKKNSGSNEQPQVVTPVVDYQKFVKEKYSNSETIIIKGNFTGEGESAAVVEEKPKEYGIKFIHLTDINNEIKTDYESSRLEGAIEKSLTEKKYLEGFANDLLYYSSQSFFMGSSQGDIYLYLVNFKTKQVYYAHLFYEDGATSNLYMSSNNVDVTKKFFISELKKDFSDFKITNKDATY